MSRRESGRHRHAASPQPAAAQLSDHRRDDAGDSAAGSARAPTPTTCRTSRPSSSTSRTSIARRGARAASAATSPATGRRFVLSGTLDRTDVFYPDGSYTTYGGLPRINFNRGRAPDRQVAVLFRRRRRIRDHAPQHGRQRRRSRLSDQGLTRLDVTPIAAHPVHAVAVSHGQLDDRLARHLLDREPRQRPAGGRAGRPSVSSTSTRGSPGRSSAASSTPGATDGVKFKHVIEPVFTIRRVSAIDVFDRIVQLESARLHRRRRLGIQLWPEQPPLRQADRVARSPQRRAEPELLHRRARRTVRSAVSEQQLQLARRRASTRRWPSCVARRPPTRLQGDFRTEWDPTFHTLKTFAGNGSINSRQVCRRRPAGAGGATFPGCRATTTRRLPNHYLNALGELAHDGLTRSAAPTRSTTTCSSDSFLQQRYPGLLQRAVLRLRRRVPGLQLRRRSPASQCRRIAASTCRSRSPASARFRTFSARSAGRHR